VRLIDVGMLNDGKSCAMGNASLSHFMQEWYGVLGLTSLYMTKMISDNYNRVANSS